MVLICTFCGTSVPAILGRAHTPMISPTRHALLDPCMCVSMADTLPTPTCQAELEPSCTQGCCNTNCNMQSLLTLDFLHYKLVCQAAGYFNANQDFSYGYYIANSDVLIQLAHRVVVLPTPTCQPQPRRADLRLLVGLLHCQTRCAKPSFLIVFLHCQLIRTEPSLLARLLQSHRVRVVALSLDMPSQDF